MATTLEKSVSARRFDSLHQEAFLNLWRTYDRLRELEDALFGEHELTAQQYNTLRLLRGARPRKMPTLFLAAKLVSRAADITRLLDRLAERGLVERERPAANRRVVNVEITPEGIALLNRLDSAVRDCHLQQLGHLKPAELAKLIDLLRRARAPHEAAGSDWQ